MKRIFITSILLLHFITGFSQQIIKLEDAINTAIKNHWTVRISENLKYLSEQQLRSNYLALVPQISLNAATSTSTNNLSQQFASGLDVNRKGAKSNNTNGNLIADFTIFNGFRLYHSHNKYKELTKGAELNLSLARENLVYDVSFNYFGIIRRKLELNELKKSMTYSQERVKIAEMKFNSGGSAKPEYLQALLDLNTRKSEVLRKEQEIIELKSTFNTLLGQEASIEFDVTDTLTVNTSLNLNNLLSSLQNNKSIGVQKSLIAVSEHQLKEERSAYFPRINATATYSYVLNKNQAGFQLYNQTTGLNTGIGLSWDLFAGGTRKINSLTRKTETLNLKLENDQLSSEVKSLIFRQYRKLQTTIAIYTIENENYQLSIENLNIATERYKLGMSTMLELIEAQRNVDIAASRLFQSNFESKIAELDIKKSTGQLWP